MSTNEWEGPIQGLVTSGYLGLESGVIHFAFEFGVPIAGWYVPDGPQKRFDVLNEVPGIRVHQSGNSEEAQRENLKLCDAVVVLGPPPAWLQISGKPCLSFCMDGEDWKKDLKTFVTTVRPPRLLVVASNAPAKLVFEHEQFAFNLLTVAFAAGDPRDPDKSLITTAEVEARIAALTQRYAYQFTRCYPEIETGWIEILEQLCADVDRALAHPAIKSRFRWIQIKERFARLAAYFEGGPLSVNLTETDSLEANVYNIFVAGDAADRPTQTLWDLISPLVAQASKRCSHTCAECGAPGSVRKRMWWRALCNLHARPGWTRRS